MIEASKIMIARMQTHTAKVVSAVWSNEITSFPAQTSLKSSFMILIVSSQTSLLFLWQKKKNLQSKKQRNKSDIDTHMRESGGGYFSIFFPFFTFTTHDTGTIDWNDFIFTCGFRKSSPCCCDFLRAMWVNKTSVVLKFSTLIAAASARIRVGSSFGNEDTWIVSKSRVQVAHTATLREPYYGSYIPTSSFKGYGNEIN